MEPNIQNTQQQTDKKSFLWIVIVLIALAVCGIVAAVVLLNDGNSSESQPTTANTQSIDQANTASLSAEPDSATVEQENLVNVSIYVDSGDEVVNAVQANISYPTDKFTFIAVQTDESAFTIEAENKEEDGIIKIARGEIEPVSGKQLVAVVQLRAENTSGNADIAFTEGTAVISATTNEDLLGSSPGVQLTIEEN